MDTHDTTQETRGPAHNGFKPGYLNFVEEKLQVALLDSGLKAKPHIESRIKTLKRDFHIVYDILNGPNTSGFGMDPIKTRVTAKKHVWNVYLKPAYVPWKNKPFPFYGDLLAIFGRDMKRDDKIDSEIQKMLDLTLGEIIKTFYYITIRDELIDVILV
ncbi:hypothetical protein C2S53_002737 [Perilla frutescens var. hirtella]|uniref:Myb/SANT-like domain-containing protein n=1 Tax=Perilla frutescens var. hirtella TaxID=608512 RepID=A0AAD4P1B2_PERFH|nr:hypothetical protein C2S53_002737 [Perilla frutescens var. hirtella]